MLRVLAAVTVGALLAAGPQVRADDGTLKARVEERLRKAGLDRRADVHVVVEHGTVVLTGAATTVADQRAAERAARKEARAVESRIAVVPSEASSEAQVRKAVADSILRYPRVTIFDAVGFELKDGLVTLQGSVRQPYRKDDVEALVAKVPGVTAIRNEIAVQRVSLFDDRLRLELARAIYGDDRFAPYAGWPNPPIRILVDGGRVTLVGSVASAVDQALVGHIARGVMSFGVQNRVQVESASRGGDGVSL